MVATLFAAVGVLALVLLGGKCLRGVLQGIEANEWSIGTGVGILAWISAGLIHARFVSHPPDWGLSLYFILVIPTILMASMTSD